MSFAVVELDFEAMQSIRSLPPFHGARWAAVFRHACRAAAVDMDSLLLGIMPWRHGTESWAVGQSVGLRLLVDATQLENVQTLLAYLQRGVPGEGEFIIGQTLCLRSAYCGLSGKDILQRGQTPSPIIMENFFATARALSQCSQWSLRCAVPMRLPRPQGQRGTGGKYCDQSFFQENPSALQHIVEKIRFLPWPCLEAETWPTQEKSTLTWQDMRYNKERGIALGGVTGELFFSSPPSPSLALNLAFGQFSGVGKNPRFGLGYYALNFL